MDIVIVCGEIAYEGRTILGVFRDKDAAIAHCKLVEKTRDEDIAYDYYWAEGWTIGRDTWDWQVHLRGPELAR